MGSEAALKPFPDVTVFGGDWGISLIATAHCVDNRTPMVIDAARHSFVIAKQRWG